MIRKRSKLNNDFPYKKRKICKKEVECEICLDKVNEINIINVHDNHVLTVIQHIVYQMI